MTKLKELIFKLKINRFKGNIIKFNKSSYSNYGSRRNNQKFPPLNISEINENIKKFQNILKINKKIECRLLSDRTIIIRSL